MSRLISLTIDVNSRKVVIYQDLVKLYDALSLSITVLAGTTPYDFTGKTVKVFLKKSDDTKVQEETTINSNVVSVETLSNQASSQVGQVEGELIISDATGQITSSTFIYQVEGSISGEVLLESQDAIPILDDIQAKIDSYNFNADNLQTQNDAAVSKITTMTNLNNTADGLKVDLEADIATGTTLKDTLESDIGIATPLKDALETDITAGTTLKNALESDMTAGTTLKNGLEADIASANTSKTGLDQTLGNVPAIKSGLDASVSAANAFASTYSDIANANVNIVNLNYVKDAAAEIIRDSIPSGFTQLGDLDYTTMLTTPNTIKLLTDSVAYVNGYKIKIPAGTVITLSAPPATGTRDDLVFLECWKQTDVSGAITWNSRLRVVNGVDFATYPEGLAVLNSSTRSIFHAWGATANDLGSYPSARYQYIHCSNTALTNLWAPVSDNGLFIAGDVSSITVSKATLGTTDGYVYAIPMFRVHRRNSGGFSVGNSNGGLLFNTLSVTFPATSALSNGQMGYKVLSATDYNNVNVGDLYISSTSNRNSLYYGYRIISKNGGYQVTVEAITNGTVDSLSGHKVDRPELISADIVYERDMIDLRHQVALTGFNHQQLLEENFDKLLRGELQTSQKTQMLKTYHGIPKTPTDANTIFYASLDGTTTPELSGGTTISANTSAFAQSVTGLGCKGYCSYLAFAVPSSIMTIDFWMDVSQVAYQTSYLRLFSFEDYAIGTYNLRVEKTANVSEFQIIVDSGSGAKSVTFNISGTLKFCHLRFTFNGTTLKIYVNGTLSKTSTIAALVSMTSKLAINPSTTNVIISDVSISNIDRGSTFATLPQDFIDNYARISPAFNEQRNVYSDALTSETNIVQVKANGGNGKAITTTQATGGQWTTGDTVKVKGLAGEIISGVMDSDTAIARVVQASTTTLIYLDDVSKFAINDTVTLNGGSTIYTISAIDATNKTITVNTAVTTIIGDLLFETTASSSAPLVKATATGTAQAGASNTMTLPTTFNATDGAYNGLTITILSGTGLGQVRTIASYVGSTKVATMSMAWTTIPDSTSVFSISGVSVAGTWSNLGTNQATFTLGTLYALNNQDLWITYSLNEVAGQGGIGEVLTTTLAGESNGKKLAVNPTIHIRDDYFGKISGSTVENPNIFKSNNSGTQTSLLLPSTMPTEFSSVAISATNTLDGSTIGISSTANGGIPQTLFSFNLIRIVEDKFGILPCANDTASKIAWLRANIIKIGFSWWGYGSNPSGNAATLYRYNALTSTWFSAGTNTANTSTLIAGQISAAQQIIEGIDTNGFYHVLAATTASNGTTASTIYTDYVNVELTLNTPINYDVLSPENPRRDDGKGNILLVRKENKEIQTMFPRDNTSGIVTYGDYVPKQGILPTTLTLAGGYSLVMPKVYLATLTTRATGMVFNPKTYLNFLDEYLAIDNTISSALTDGTQLYADDTVEYSMLISSNIKGGHSAYSNINIGKIYLCSSNTLTLIDSTTSSIVRYIDVSMINNSNSAYVSLSCWLMRDINGMLYLLIGAASKVLRGKTAYHPLTGASRILAFQLNKKPLIK